MSHRAAMRFATAAALALSVCPSFADSIPTAGDTDDRIRIATYRDDEVYRIAGRIGYQIDLEFAPGEKFVGLAAGDIQALSFEAQDNHLFLKPRAARVATNVTVLTDRHHYQFDYRVPAQRLDGEGNPVPAARPIYALRFIYPQDEAKEAAQAARQQAADTAKRQISADLNALSVPTNRDYWYCGPRAIKPTAVVDDGVHTRFTFGARTELPAIFTRAADGSESLVNYTVTEAGLTVHRVSPQFILRRGHLVGCVINKSFDGAGERLPSGTMSTAVERRVPAEPDIP
jgi:type IV secretion system protein VirB9